MTLIIVIIIALILFVVLAYNSMIKLRNKVKEAWSDIDVQLKRRYNLIPNIVETVKGYASHESDVLTQVTEARAKAINATNVKDQGSAENMLSGILTAAKSFNINIPETEIDAIQNLQSDVDSLTEKLNESINKNSDSEKQVIL